MPFSQSLVREAALHVKAGAALGAPFDRLGEQPVDLAGVRFGRGAAAGIGRQEGAIQLVRPAARSCGRRSNRTGAEAAGDRRRRYAACPENRTSTASGTGFRRWSKPAAPASGNSFRRGSRPGGNSGRSPRARGLPGWRDRVWRVRHHHWLPRCGTMPGGMRRWKPSRRCRRDIAVEQPALLAPGKREAQGKAFDVQPADRPADIRGGDAFDEIGARAFVQIGLQLLAPGAAAGRSRRRGRHAAPRESRAA